MDHPITVMSSSKKRSELQETEGEKTDGQRKNSMSRMESPRDTGNDEESRNSTSSMKEKDGIEETNGVNMDVENDQGRAPNYTGDTGMDADMTESHAQKKISFPNGDQDGS